MKITIFLFILGRFENFLKPGNLVLGRTATALAVHLKAMFLGRRLLNNHT